MPLPIVAIVGKPNVGKSTLFNRIIKSHTSVVDAQPGVTRDRIYAEAEWNAVNFTLVDTGGWILPHEGDLLAEEVRQQTLIAAQEADLILFVADGLTGITEEDRVLARIIHQKNASVIFIANKVDDLSQLAVGYELTNLGLGDVHPLSARTGFQVAEMLEAVIAKLRTLKPTLPDKPDPEELSLAIIGAPNVGKSSLVNRLSGVSRMVVSDIPGTTRDAVDTIIKHYGKSIRLIDTAGLRRKRFGLKGLDFYTTIRSLRALERCNVAAIIIDAVTGPTAGDVRLVNQAAETGAGVLVIVNKWDAVEKDHKSYQYWLEDWHRRAHSLTWAPVIFISALTGQRAIKVIEKSLEINEQRNKRIPTPDLNDQITAKLIHQPPPAVKGKFIRIKYGAQVSAAPPLFVFHASHSQFIGDAYKRFTERLLRDTYGFEGVPIRVVFRKK